MSSLQRPLTVPEAICPETTIENLCSLYGEARELFGRIFLTVKVSLVVRYLKNRNRRKKFRFSKILIDKACWSPYCRMSGIFLTDARDKVVTIFSAHLCFPFIRFPVSVVRSINKSGLYALSVLVRRCSGK